MKVKGWFVGLLAFAVLGSAGCASFQRWLLRRAFQEPSVRLARVGLKGLDFAKATLGTVVVLSNPNPYPLRAARLTCELFVDTTNAPLARVERKDPVHLRPRRSTEVDFDVVLRFDALPLRALKATNIPFVLKGEVGLDVGGGAKLMIPFRHAGSVPAPRTPTVRLVRLGMPSFSLSALRAEMEVVVAVSNRNPYGLPLKDFRFDLNLNGRPVLQGMGTEGGGSVALGPYSRKDVRVAFVLDLGRVKELVSALLEGKVNFGLKGNYRPDVESPPRWEYDFADEGTATVLR